MHALLKAGHSIAVHVGGIAEMFEVYPDKEVIHLSRRRGFVRAAVQHGVPIVPMYHFGVTQILSFCPRCEACCFCCATTLSRALDCLVPYLSVGCSMLWYGVRALSCKTCAYCSPGNWSCQCSRQSYGQVLKLLTMRSCAWQCEHLYGSRVRQLQRKTFSA
jgi:hypothetical protein